MADPNRFTSTPTQWTHCKNTKWLAGRSLDRRLGSHLEGVNNKIVSFRRLSPSLVNFMADPVAHSFGQDIRVWLNTRLDRPWSAEAAAPYLSAALLADAYEC